jgi:hypothetical protein
MNFDGTYFYEGGAEKWRLKSVEGRDPTIKNQTVLYAIGSR